MLVIDPRKIRLFHGVNRTSILSSSDYDKRSLIHRDSVRNDTELIQLLVREILEQNDGSELQLIILLGFQKKRKI